MLTSTLARLGHESVGTIAANWKISAGDALALADCGSASGVESFIAADSAALEPIVQSLQPDFVFSWGFPWRIPDGALNAPKFGSINYHPSLLPRHRGPFPVAWTVRMGDENFGVTWHRMDSAFDAGPILAQRSTPACVEDTSADIVPRLASLGLRMLRGVIDRAVMGDPGDPQPLDGATKEGPFESDYVMIDWSRPARDVHDQVRAWRFIPRIYSVMGALGELDGRTVRVLRTTLQDPEGEGHLVHCGDGPIWVLQTEPLD